MTGSGFRALPKSVLIVLILLLLKALFGIIEYVLPYLAPPMPLPFYPGLFAFAVPSVVIPLLILFSFQRLPATGYWGTIAYVPLSILFNVTLIGTPYLVTGPLGIPVPDPYATARFFETAGRVTTSIVSLALLFALLRRPVRRWVTQREEVILAQRYPSRRTPSLAERGTWVFPLVTGILAPTAVWLSVQLIVGRIPLGDSLLDILLEHLKGRALLLNLFSLLPFIVLASISHHNAGRIPSVTLWSVTIGGIFGILALMVPAYWVAWETIYNTIPGDEKTMGALVFFFTPLYCLATMFAGMLLGWVFARIVRRGVDDIVDDL